MHDDTDLAPVMRETGLPLILREGAREGGECVGALFEAIGESIRALAHTIRLALETADKILVMGLSFRSPARH